MPDSEGGGSSVPPNPIVESSTARESSTSDSASPEPVTPEPDAAQSTTAELQRLLQEVLLIQGLQAALLCDRRGRILRAVSPEVPEVDDLMHAARDALRTLDTLQAGSKGASKHMELSFRDGRLSALRLEHGALVLLGKPTFSTTLLNLISLVAGQRADHLLSNAP